MINASAIKPADILIVGAGMVGSLLAALLRDSGLRIVMLEREAVTLPEIDANFEPRVSALTRASENLLKHVGAWRLMASRRVCAYSGMEVWDGDGSGHIQFSAAELGEAHLGVLVENRLLQWALTEAALMSPNVELCLPASLARLERMPQGWIATLDDGRVIQAKLIIGADGARSRVREQLGISVRSTDYQQQAIVTTVRTEKPHGFVARQRFTPAGPLAFLPLTKPSAAEQYCSIVWSQDNAEAERLLALDDAAFCRELSAAFEYSLGEVLSSDKRFSFPLRAQHATRYTADAAVLMGDAAHAIHPLAGQGVNLGLLDAAVLAEEIERARSRGLAITDDSILTRYSRRRRAHNTLILNGMTGFKMLFGTRNPAAVVLRNLGLGSVNQLSPIKQEFARVAMGLAGDLPAAAK